MIFENIKSFSFDKNRDHKFGIKSAIIYANSKLTNGTYPILYISKPKHISEVEYEELLESIKISFILKQEGK